MDPQEHSRNGTLGPTPKMTPTRVRKDNTMARKYLDDPDCPLCHGPNRLMDPVAAEAHRHARHGLALDNGDPMARLRELNAVADRGEPVDYGELRQYLR
jgi:hypothetical protein